MFRVHAAAVSSTGCECLKGLLESPWETHRMRGSPNCGWQSWGQPADEVQTDLRCIFKDHQSTLHPGDHLYSACLSPEFSCHMQIDFSFPVFSVKYNSGNGPFGFVLNSVGMSSCPSSRVKDTEKPLPFQRKPNFIAGSYKQTAECAVYCQSIELWRFLIGRICFTVCRWTKCSTKKIG